MSPTNQKNDSNGQVNVVKDNPLTRPAEMQHKNASGVAPWIDKIKSHNTPQTISANEITSLSALIAYAAFKTGSNEFRIERDLADRFNVANITCLPASRFDEALRYLVDKVPARAA